MFCLGHRFLNDSIVDEFTGGFGVWQLEEAFEGDGSKGCLDHDGLRWGYLDNLACFLEFGEVVTIGSIFGVVGDDAEGF